jgi:general transcription factor 3C polypeptide 5 (transcription factor C subunit 1)
MKTATDPPPLLPAQTPQVPHIEVVLRPEDVFAQGIPAIKAITDCVLLKVTLPKRTGRKRKRGSDHPFVEDPASKEPKGPLQSKDVLQRLRDNPHSYQVSGAGRVRHVYRFRSKSVLPRHPEPPRLPIQLYRSTPLPR